MHALRLIGIFPVRRKGRNNISCIAITSKIHNESRRRHGSVWFSDSTPYVYPAQYNNDVLLPSYYGKISPCIAIDMKAEIACLS